MKRRPSEQRAKEKHTRNNGGTIPRQSAGWSERWDEQGRSGCIVRRKPVPINPHCHSTVKWPLMVAQWEREGLSVDLVRTRLDSDDVVVAAAAYQFIKRAEK